MRLFLDDTRKFPSYGYECCRDSKSAFFLLSVMKDFEFITLDYSLGGGDTGMEVLVWMKENNFFCHTLISIVIILSAKNE